MRDKLHRLFGDESGVVMAVVLVVTGLLSAVAMTYTRMVSTDTVLRAGAARARAGFYAAEAGLNVAMAETRAAFEGFEVLGVRSGSVTVGQRTAHYDLQPVAECSPCPPATIPAGELFAGLNTIRYRYAVSSMAVNREGDEEASLGAEFEVHNVPIFQFLAFYAKDLEILPGPDMNLHGRIHANANLYLSAAGTLSVADSQNPDIPFVQVTAVDKIYRGRKDDNTCGGKVEIDKLEDADGDGSFDPLVLPCKGGSNPVSDADLAAYVGSVQAGVDRLAVPTVDTIKRGGDGAFWQKADLRIVLRLDVAGAPVNFGAFCPGAVASPALYPIEAQNAAGGRDAAKTQALWRLLCEMPGAVFYNDVPNGAVDGNPSDGLASVAAKYTPNFGANGLVYRRVGVDTNGDGAINNKDRNDDICPGTGVWWNPASCVGRPAGSWFDDMDYRRGGFYNHREQRWMYLLNVNVRALIEWNGFNGGPLFAPTDSSDGGPVLFLSVQGPQAAAMNNYGVRVFDSANLDTTGVTFTPGADDPTGLAVISDQAIYVQGNYNYYRGQPPGAKYPASLIGDSLNVLSQSWERPVSSGGNAKANDRKSLGAFGHRRIQASDSPCGAGGCGTFDGAADLGINAAFLSGVDETAAGSYNGGLENYPRFHEDWSGRSLNYRGSFVSLGNPLHVDGPWSYGSPVYTAPKRPWDYDADFNDVKNLPPLTPKVTFLQQRVYTRFYK